MQCICAFRCSPIPSFFIPLFEPTSLLSVSVSRIILGTCGHVQLAERLVPQYVLLWRSLVSGWGTRPQAWRCIVRLPQATHFCGIIVELAAKRRFQSYSAFWQRQGMTQTEQSLSGTDWDKYMCMEKGEIHLHSGVRPSLPSVFPYLSPPFC